MYWHTCEHCGHETTQSKLLEAVDRKKAQELFIVLSKQIGIIDSEMKNNNIVKV